MHDIVKPVIS